MPSRKSKKLKRPSKAQTVGIPITVDVANADADADADAPADNYDVDSDTHTMPAPSATLIETTASTNIAQEEPCVSDSDKEQEYLNDAAIFLNNHSNEDASSAKMQAAEGPCDKVYKPRLSLSAPRRPIEG
jgi:hypothetical protein